MSLTIVLKGFTQPAPVTVLLSTVWAGDIATYALWGGKCGLQSQS